MYERVALLAYRPSTSFGESSRAAMRGAYGGDIVGALAVAHADFERRRRRKSCGVGMAAGGSGAVARSGMSPTVK